MKLVVAGVCLALSAALLAGQSIRVVPDSIVLGGDNPAQRFVIISRSADESELDVTAESTIALPPVARLTEPGRVVAVADGQGSLTATWRGRVATVPLRVADHDRKRPFSFGRDIDTIFTKRGCNDTNCHGSVKGRGGLKLSASGIAPKDDYEWVVKGGIYQVLTMETGPRIPRVDLKEPEKSLLLLKPTMSVPHGGGRRFAVHSADYEKILAWVRSGAPFGVEDGPGVRVEAVEVFPKESVLQAKSSWQLLVTARLSDGTRADITEQATYSSNNPDVVKVSESGRMEAAGSGETAILIRAAGHTVSAVAGVIEKAASKYPAVPRTNFIDDHIFAKLRRYNVVPSALSSDAEFLRRLCLDLTGTLPPPERVREFLADTDPKKRERLIETLLQSPEYIDFWSFRLGDLLRVTFTSQNTPKMTQAYADWVHNAVAQNKPYDRIARERIAAQGYGAAARDFYRYTELIVPQEIMSEQVRVFLGRRLDCAQCHNHPYETWSQDQFWGLTAFFGRLTEIRENSVVIDDPAGGHVGEHESVKVIHPRTKQEVQPAFLDGRVLPPGQRLDLRMRFADWVVASPYFAETAVNRMWGYFFGRGIVEPVDDFRSTNPATHPELLAALAQDFRQHGYDLKHLMRTILESRTYQLSGIPNETNRNDLTNYSHALPRRLEAAVLLDAISRVTGVPEDFKLPLSDPALQKTHGAYFAGTLAVNTVPELCPSTFLDVYGRSMRKTSASSGNLSPNLPQALHTWAGTTYTTKIGKDGGRLDQMLKSDASDRQIVEEFYLAAFSRYPSARERDSLESFLTAKQARRQTMENFVWALISSGEFTYNH